MKPGRSKAGGAAQRALLESESRYRSVVEALDEGVVLQDAEGRVVAFNSAAQRLLRLPAAELEGRTAGDPIWRPVDASGAPLPLEAHPSFISLRTGRACNGVVLGMQFDGGSTTWLSVNSRALVEPGTDVRYGVVVSFQDITARVAAERALQCANEALEERVAARTAELRRALDQAHAREAQLSALLGCARAVLEHQTFAECAEALVASCRDVVGAGRASLELAPASSASREVHLDDDGAVLVAPVVLGSAAEGLLTLADKTGGFTPEDARTVGAFAEMAAVALAHNRAREQLQASVHEKEVLLREVHHRVKNNLQVIASMLNLQAATLSEPEQRLALLESQNRVRTLALIHEKLYGAVQLSRVPLHSALDELTAHVVRSFRCMTEGIPVRLELAEVELGVETAIPVALIYNELLSNALRHAFADGRRGQVTVRLRSLGDCRYELSVADDGVGFPDGVDPREGSSLGLQLVRALTQQLGGDVGFAREHGTTVALTFRAEE